LTESAFSELGSGATLRSLIYGDDLLFAVADAGPAPR